VPVYTAGKGDGVWRIAKADRLPADVVMAIPTLASHVAIDRWRD
jgi:hypothetical protein